MRGIVTLVVAIACARAAQPSPAADSTTGPWRDAEPPPLVAGIRLGDSLARVRAVLGKPTSERSLMADARELAYWPPGLAVITTGDQGVALIGLLTPAAPQVAGVRVGDPVSHLVEQWGPFYRRNGARVSYRNGPWGALVIIDTAAVPQRIQSITFGWATPAKPGAITPPWPR
jgi:hypothetical protein